MAQTELLTVEQVLQLQGIGLTIMPDFSIPKAGWKNSTQQVHIVKPNGEKLEANANSRSGISTFAIHLYRSISFGVWSFRSLLWKAICR